MTTQEKIIHYRERGRKELVAQVRALKRQGKVLSAERDIAYFTMDKLVEALERSIIRALRAENELEKVNGQLASCLSTRHKVIKRYQESRAKIIPDSGTGID